MYTNYLIFYGNLWYNLNTDPEHLYILREPPLAIFAQLKPIPFLKEIFWVTKNKCVKSIYILKISLAKE